MVTGIVGGLRQANPTTLLVFTVSYALALVLGERAYGTLAVPSPFWLPDSILLCALLVAPRSSWWAFVALIVPIRLLVGVVPGTPLWFQLFTALTDALKGFGAGWLLHRCRPVRLNSLSQFLIFLAVAAAGVPLLSALAAAPARAALGTPWWPGMFQWFLGNSLAQVIVTPMMLYWCNREYRHPRARLGELAVLSTGLSAALFYAFVVDRTTHSLNVIYMPVPFLIWAAVRLRPFGTANAIALVALVSMLGAVRGTGVFAGDAARHSVLSLQIFLLVIGITLLLLAVLIAQQEVMRERERELNSQLIKAQERERARIARELHDDMGQRLNLLLVDIEQIRETPDLPLAVRDELKGLVLRGGRLSSDIHTLSHQLHPSTIAFVGLEVALRGLCREFAARHQMQVRFDSRDVPTQIGPDVRICLFRIVQEGLHNVNRHSGVRAAAVDLSCHREMLVLCISDSGVGFDSAAVNERPSLGFVSMQERLRSIGGRLTIQSWPLIGTRILVEVPLQVQVVASLSEPLEVAARR